MLRTAQAWKSRFAPVLHERQEMAMRQGGERTQQFAVRFPESLVARLDRMVVRMQRKQPGMRITRADLIRMLVIRSLDQMDAEESIRPEPPSRSRSRN